jgi:hypothetical protein
MKKNLDKKNDEKTLFYGHPKSSLECFYQKILQVE